MDEDIKYFCQKKLKIVSTAECKLCVVLGLSGYANYTYCMSVNLIPADIIVDEED